jgi:hypothetical protein
MSVGRINNNGIHLCMHKCLVSTASVTPIQEQHEVSKRIFIMVACVSLVISLAVIVPITSVVNNSLEVFHLIFSEELSLSFFHEFLEQLLLSFQLS